MSTCAWLWESAPTAKIRGSPIIRRHPGVPSLRSLSFWDGIVLLPLCHLAPNCTVGLILSRGFPAKSCRNGDNAEVGNRRLPSASTTILLAPTSPSSPRSTRAAAYVARVLGHKQARGIMPAYALGLL